MNASSSTSNNSEAENKLSALVGEWKKNNELPGYDPVPFLTTCAKLFEEELVVFHKGDPDPFDDRHPQYIQPDCAFGKILLLLSKTTDLMGKLTSTYIRTQNHARDVPPIALATARLLLSASPGLELPNVLKENEWLAQQFLGWLRNAEEPARTYATGILVGAISPQRTSNSEYIALISILLKRLWNHVRPGKYSEDQCKITSEPDHQNLSQSNSSQTNTSSSNGIVSHKRKYSGSSSETAPKKVYAEKTRTHADFEGDLHKPFKRTLGFAGNCFTSPNSQRCVADDGEKFPFLEDFYDNDLSNSSWSEQMPAMLGCDYSLDPPLSPSVRQRYIFDFLKCLGEYQDLLSIFLELRTLNLINIYLNERKSDGLLTFNVLEFLSSILCHNKVATEFIELGGIENLMRVQRPSMGSTGVSLCLYYLAYRKEAMERVCQLPGRVLSEMVKYSVWLLECSHETGRSHAALFFSISFSFRFVLSLFDRMNGLRCLVNMISTSKPIVHSLDDMYDPDEDANRHFIRQTTRTVCAALRKYFEAHLLIKICAAQRTLPKSEHQYPSIESVSKYKSAACSREQFFECLLTLGELPEDDSNGTRSLSNWPPVLTFHRLDGVQLMLKVIHIAAKWLNFAGQIEVVRSALDVLAVTTLSRVPRMLLAKQHTLDKKLTGVDILLSIAKDQDLSFDGETQKSALAVLLNCVRGLPATTEQVGTSTKSVRNTPKYIKKYKKSKEALWKRIQQGSGIDALLTLLMTTQPAPHADELRYLTCKVLLGLTNYKPVCQIMSKLPFFVNGQIQTVAREPVLNDKKRVHEKFCKSMETLFEKVTGKPISLHIDLDAVRKSHVVSETHMRYKNKDLLLIIHNHLQWSKLHNAADALAQEAELFSAENQSDDVSAVSRSRVSAVGRNIIAGGGDATPVSRRISFTRGSRALSVTPTSSAIVSFATPSKKKIPLTPKQGRSTVYIESDGQKRFKLSHTGVVTVKPKSRNLLSQQSPPSPPTLNSIVEENFRHQHARCRNPVVTVPEFSLFTPHHCPEPRYKVEAPLNITKRLHHRQGIRPRRGGIGGFSCDLQLIYSRYKPGYIIKSATEDQKVPFCSVAFMPGDEKIILGDTQGNVIMHTMYSNEGQLAQEIASAPILSIEPSRNGNSILVTSESYWSNSCTIHTVGEHMDLKQTFDDVDYVEFEKTLQDKVLGTSGYKAVVFDIETGESLDTFEREDMSCHYKDNRATFSPDGNLLLCDGLLWDVRSSSRVKPLHKFDQFNACVSGVFHPSGLEAIINTEVWDLRNYHLLRSVPALDQCDIKFNTCGSIMYAVRRKTSLSDSDESVANKALMSAFRTFDASDYKQLAFVPVRNKIYDLAADAIDRNIAVIESISDDRFDDAMSICRLYEVGMARGDEDEDEEESSYEERSTDGSSSSGDDDDDSPNSTDNELADLGDILNNSDSSFSEVDSTTSGEDNVRGGNDRTSSDNWVTTDGEESD